MTTGVGLHLPMFIDARDMHYRLQGMGLDASMLVGMCLIVAGIATVAFSLVQPAPREKAAPVSIRPLDDAPLGRAHIALLLVLSFAVTIDVMKPLTIGFVVPGMAVEYGLKSPLNPHGHVPVAWFPLLAIIGTTIGSLLWGAMGDRIGRRASILIAAVIFMGTAICGTMPDYHLNFAMCFLMGVGVGGMLPITFSLISETTPARHRGWLMVLIGGDVALAYLVTSWLSSTLTPHFGWRALWLVGLPTGLLLIGLNRWIPESPRYLIARGRTREAEAVMARYGARAVPVDELAEVVHGHEVQGRWREMASAAFRRNTVIIAVLGLAVGVVSFGFQLWMPSNLQALGYNDVSSADIVRDSALFGLPATALVAALYGLWSSKGTMLLLAVLTAASLVTLAAEGDGIIHHRTLLYVLLAIPITAASSLLAVLAAYASEVFPTRIRSRATGVAAGASKAGGVAVTALVVAAATPPSIRNTALLGAAAMGLSAVAIATVGMETRSRRLEEITADELRLAVPAAGTT